jgi:sorting nexin-29
MCWDTAGNVITDKAQILKRWVQYFVNLLNRTTQQSPEEDIERNDFRPTKEEIEEAIEKLKNNKAPGINSIQAALLKYGSQEFIQILQKLLELTWRKESIPNEWRNRIICPLHKRGDPLQCINYRGMTLLNTTYKVFSKILYAKLLPYAEKVLGNYKSGFQRGKSTLDLIHTLKQILEKTGELSIETHHLFINFSSAYDSINRYQLFAAMEEFRIPDKLVRLGKATMENSQCQVKVKSKLSDTLSYEWAEAR